MIGPKPLEKRGFKALGQAMSPDISSTMPNPPLGQVAKKPYLIGKQKVRPIHLLPDALGLKLTNLVRPGFPLLVGHIRIGHQAPSRAIDQSL